MIVKVKKGLIKINPFNPKHELKPKEKAYLKHSIDKNGFIGYPIILKDYLDPDKYILLDGNTRIDMIEGDEIECYLAKKEIKSERELKEITLDYTAAFKKTNKKRLFEMNQELGLEEMVYKDMFVEININFSEVPKTINTKTDDFFKVKIFKFKDEQAFEKFSEIYKKLKNKLFDNEKIQKYLSDQIDKLNDDKISDYLFDIILNESLYE
jgi:hypothetical protein